MAPHPTPFADVNAVVNEFHAKFAALLGSHLRGVYLIGSLALGDFNPKTSDIDFIVVTDMPIDDAVFGKLQQMHAAFAASDSTWAVRVEAVYVTLDALRSPIPGEREYPQIERGTALFKAPLEKGWIFQSYTLWERAVVVSGDDPRTLIDPIDARDMRPAVAAMVDVWLEQSRTDPEWLTWVRERNSQVFVVLTLCRMLYSLATGDVASKPAAAQWAQANLPQRWALLIAATFAKQYETDDISQAELEETVAFVAFAAEQSR